MVYLKYNKVKLPAFDDYSIVKSSQEITFSDLKCDFDGYTKEDLPEKYQEVKVVEEQKMNQQVEEIECEEKQKVKELTFVSEVNKPITIKKIYGYSAQATRSGKNKFALTTIKSSSSFQVTSTGINLKSCWTTDLYTYDELVKILKPNTAYTMKAKAKVVSRPSTILSHQYAAMLLYRPYSSSLGGVVTPVLQMADKETITLDTEKEYITTFITPTDLTDMRLLAYSFYGNDDGSTTGVPQGEIDLTEVMLIEGTYTAETFPEYEPYGISPSPDYPSQIENACVTENINIKIQNIDKTQEQDMQITLAKPLYQDCYLAEDGIHFTRKQVVLDGSEDEAWSLSATNTSNQNRFTSKIIENEVKRPSNADEIANIICSHFIKESANETYRRSDGIAIHPNGSIYLYYNAFKEYTIDQFKTWLSNNPITLEYELTEKVIEPYTEEQKRDWNNIQNLISYLGTNNLTSTANMDIKYPLRAKQKIIPTIYEKLLYIGYIDTYDFGELRETDVDNDINITLLSPMKLATLRTAIAIGTYTLKDLIESRILQPLIDDGFKLKEINITDRQVTVNFLSETIEYCMNNLSNKFNFWWYIDEKKNIYVKDINLMLTEKTDLIYDDTHRIEGLEYIKPITNSDDYANVINFKNVRIYEYSRLKLNGSVVVETHNPLIKKQLSDDVTKDNQIEFEFPIDINKENIAKSAKSNGIIDTIIYGIYVKGTYSDNTTFSFFISYNRSNKAFETSENLGFDGEENEKEFLLIKDSFFGNLITGFKFNNENKNIKSIEEIRSDSALIWNTNKFYNDKGILSKRGIISNTGIVELTLNMNESWKTIQELTEIGSSYLNKNSLNYADELEVKTDCDVLEIGNTIYINKFLIDGKYVVTEIQQIYENGDTEYIVKCKSANMLSNFVDIFRGESSQESSDKTYQLYVTHYEEEGINERFEVVQ